MSSISNMSSAILATGRWARSGGPLLSPVSQGSTCEHLSWARHPKYGSRGERSPPAS